ncbi:Glycine-rich RNA-binding protein RZ1C [Sesamum alatum]|uniref:Glycine-rich RNA-binding protein RZ1C n=1 Tax=Sesamum alatum TaxID=300844 RepID=A0AAE2CVH8_9LAMI|nr:Glycine-rich RNA-binding protein RZ1C [Sesamum alatum]
MADKDQDNRIFVGGLSYDVTERQLENAFSRFGKIVECQVMLERDTGRPRGLAFLTFADRRAMEDGNQGYALVESLGERVISVNKAQPKMGSEDPGHGYGSYSSGGRGIYGGDRSARQDDCFKCGRPGHWARDCPSAGAGRGARPFSPPRARYAGSGGRGDRSADYRDRYVDDRYDRGRYGDRDRL